MRNILFCALLLPAAAPAADWVDIGSTPEARIMLDRQTVEISGDTARAWLKFIYRSRQPGQTVTQGKPFDSSINQYYVLCSEQKFQVLELVMFNQNDTVGSFHGHLDAANYASARPASGAMFLIDRICPNRGAARAG